MARDRDPLTASKARSLRVLMVLDSNFPNLGGGGAESQLRTLALRMIERGHQVTIVTPLLPGGPQSESDECEGIPVLRLRYPRVHVVGGVVLCLRLAGFLLGPGRSSDAWHVHIAHNLGVVACAAGWLVRKPVVLKVAGWRELELGILAPGGGLVRQVMRATLRRASTVHATSTRIAKDLYRLGFSPERVMILPNAVDTSRFQPRTRARDPGSPFTVVFVGRLVEEKGLDTLLDAWAAALAGREHVRLLLAGEGRLESRLREQAARLGIAGQVKFLGDCARVEDLLQRADLGVLPSRIEGLSNTLLEFMASGLPTIASRVSGSEDFVRPGHNGWLFPPSDADALAVCLREAVDAPPERLLQFGQTARADVVAAASLDQVVTRLLEAYERKAHSEPKGD
jgi:L-malate glycosyltransferase